jgi:hypothetical protein
LQSCALCVSFYPTHKHLHTVHKTASRLLRDYSNYTLGWIPHAVSYNLYSWRWAYKCPKHVELVYDNKLHLLHQVGSSRHSSTRFGSLQRPFISGIGSKGNHLMIVCFFKQNPTLQFECIRRLRFCLFCNVNLYGHVISFFPKHNKGA